MLRLLIVFAISITSVVTSFRLNVDDNVSYIKSDSDQNVNWFIVENSIQFKSLKKPFLLKTLESQPSASLKNFTIFDGLGEGGNFIE